MVFRSLAIAAGIFYSALAAGATPALPPPPTYYVYDETHLMSDRAERALQALLVEHDRATGEQVVVAIFNSLNGEDLNDYVNRVFQAWKIGQRGKDNGALLAIFSKEHQARIEVGYGLEALLTDAKSSRILHEILVPAMREGKADDAVSGAAYEILVTIQSPLIQSGRAEQILKSGGYGQHANFGSTSPPAHNGWIVWVFLGFIFLSIARNIVGSREAHFTQDGWYRPKPWQKRWRSGGGGPPFLGGGGFGGGMGGGGWSGDGGGGGGFSGGGGSSGGGGASAGW